MKFVKMRQSFAARLQSQLNSRWTQLNCFMSFPRWTWNVLDKLKYRWCERETFLLFRNRFTNKSLSFANSWKYWKEIPWKYLRPTWYGFEFGASKFSSTSPDWRFMIFTWANLPRKTHLSLHFVPRPIRNAFWNFFVSYWNSSFPFAHRDLTNKAHAGIANCEWKFHNLWNSI